MLIKIYTFYTNKGSSTNIKEENTEYAPEIQIQIVQTGTNHFHREALILQGEIQEKQSRLKVSVRKSGITNLTSYSTSVKKYIKNKEKGKLFVNLKTINFAQIAVRNTQYIYIYI